jgi:hypothetical protein
MTLGELYDLKAMIESPLFQENIVKPLRDEQGKIRNNFFSDSLKESWRKGGRIEGIELFFDNLKKINEQIKTKQFEDSDEG